MGEHMWVFIHFLEREEWGTTLPYSGVVSQPYSQRIRQWEQEKMAVLCRVFESWLWPCATGDGRVGQCPLCTQLSGPPDQGVVTCFCRSWRLHYPLWFSCQPFFFFNSPLIKPTSNYSVWLCHLFLFKTLWVQRVITHWKKNNTIKIRGKSLYSKLQIRYHKKNNQHT